MCRLAIVYTCSPTPTSKSLFFPYVSPLNNLPFRHHQPGPLHLFECADCQQLSTSLYAVGLLATVYGKGITVINGSAKLIAPTVEKCFPGRVFPQP